MSVQDRLDGASFGLDAGYELVRGVLAQYHDKEVAGWEARNIQLTSRGVSSYREIMLGGALVLNAYFDGQYTFANSREVLIDGQHRVLSGVYDMDEQAIHIAGTVTEGIPVLSRLVIVDNLPWAGELTVG